MTSTKIETGKINEKVPDNIQAVLFKWKYLRDKPESFINQFLKQHNLVPIKRPHYVLSYKQYWIKKRDYWYYVYYIEKTPDPNIADFVLY